MESLLLVRGGASGCTEGSRLGERETFLRFVEGRLTVKRGPSGGL